VQRALQELITPSADETFEIVSVSSKGDPITTIYCWLHRHYQFGFRNREKLTDMFTFAYSGFNEGSITDTVTKLRKYLTRAVQFGIKVPWARLIGVPMCRILNKASHHGNVKLC
jgi:hypothetical protein